MVKLYEVLKDIKPLTYTDYYVEVPSSTCLKGYDHNYITKHKVHNIRRLTNKDKYEYVVQSSICNDISNTNDFINCLSSCAPSNPTTSYPCPATLQPTAVISLSNNINTSTSLNNLTIRVNKDAYFTNGLSNEDWIGLEIYGGTQINFNSLDICGVNLNIHDNISEMLSPPLSCNNDLIIREGNHIFNNNNYQGIDKGGVISANKISLIDASITFRKNYSITSSGGAIYAEQNLTISGDGTNIQFHDNSASSGGAIYTPDSGNIYITNISNSNMIKFYNNDASWSGGAIRTGSLTIQNISGNGVDFSNNMTNLLSTGSGGQGGAIYTKNYTNLTNSNIKFKHNLSTMGGAIHSDGSIVIIIQNDSKNLLFYDNNVSSLSKSPLITARGGAINTGSLTIKNMTNDGHVTFLNNKAINIHPDTSSGIGGAIAASKDINLKDANITFRNNYADNCGGAIYTDSSLSINGDKTNLLFHDNSATFGGAICTNYLTIKDISNSNMIKFYDNNALASGGAIFTPDTGNIYINNISGEGIDFCGNMVKSKGQGGAIQSFDVTLINANITFRKNHSTMGGAISAAGTLTIKNISNSNKIKFYNNSVNNVSGGARGGAINSLNLIFKNISSGGLDFCGNKSSGKSSVGGAISGSSKHLIDANITFRNNYADNYAGAIYTNDIITISGDKTNLLFHDNSAQQGGAIYMDVSSILKINHTIPASDFSFLNNFPTAIYFDSSSHIIECPSFNNITCAPSGEKQCKELSNGIQYNPCNDISDANGFIYCLSLCIHKVDSYYHCPVSLKPKARITLNNDIFHNNMNLIIRSNNDAYFTNGESNEDRPRLEVSGARIGLHSLDICGVNLSVYNNNIYIKHSALNCSSGLIIREGIHSFYRNRTDGDGGVIYASDISFINASITFWQNYSTRNGGAIYANKSLTIIDASITFKQNKSEFGEIGGGAIYANESLTISGNKTDILFDNNKANKYGGAIAGVYMNLIDSKIQFLDNDASSSGGAIFTKVNLTISGDKTNLIFHDNNAAGKGGAIYMNGGAWLTINHTISVSNIDFSRNNPDAIYFNPNSEIIECPSFNTINCEPSRSIQCTHLSGGVLGNS